MPTHPSISRRGSDHRWRVGLSLKRARNRLASTALVAIVGAFFLTTTGAVAKTQSFTGVVSASGTSSATRTFDAKAARIKVVLNWDASTANLDVSLKNPAGTVVARAATTSKPERLIYDAPADGTYTLVVVTRAGSANYAISVEHSKGFPRTSTNVRNWSSSFMTWPLWPTQQEAVAAARSFDVIGATPNVYRQWVDEMKPVNPDLKMLSYLNASMVRPAEESAHPEDWYAHDAAGRRITQANTGGGSGWYQMEPSRLGWVNYVVDKCASDLAYSRYDGCLLDSLGLAPLSPGYMTAIPINPSTGVAYTKSQWLAATSAIAAKVKQAVGDALVVVNGLHSGSRYFDTQAPTRRLIGSTRVDAGMVELFMRAPGDAPTRFRSEAEWKQDVDMIVNAEAAGKSLLIITKLWVSATTAQRDTIHEYALASFLLGANGLSYFEFMWDHDALHTSPYSDADLGAPLAAYTKSGGVYRRPFSKGLVLVNPTPSTVTVPLSATYVDLKGNLRTSVTLPPNRGSVLRKA